MSGLALGYLGGYLLLATMYDLRTRTIPNWIIVWGVWIGIAGHWVELWAWSYLWMGLVMVPLLVADVGRGDVKASMVIGGLFGPGSMPILLLAFGLLIPWWLLYGWGGRYYPGSGPFFCWITGATCGIVLMKWV